CSSWLLMSTTAILRIRRRSCHRQAERLDCPDRERPRMKESRTPNYGLDSPVAVRNMLIVAALGIISLITRLLGVWSRQDVIAVIARPLMLAGLSCGAMALRMIYDSKVGQIREREPHFRELAPAGVLAVTG